MNGRVLLKSRWIFGDLSEGVGPSGAFLETSTTAGLFPRLCCGAEGAVGFRCWELPVLLIPFALLKSLSRFFSDF